MTQHRSPSTQTPPASTYFMLLLAMLFGSLQVQCRELLANGAFASQPKSAAGESWKILKGSVQEVEGKQILVLDGSYASATQQVTLDPTWKALELQARVRTIDVVRGDQNWKNARIAVTFKGADGKRVGPWPDIYSREGTTPWVDYDKVYFIPSGAVSVDIAPANFGTAGSLLVEQISLEPLTGGLTGSASRPAIILKLDDLTTITPRWKRLTEFLAAEEIPASYGIIGHGLERDNPGLVAWIKELHEGGQIEFWNHGYKSRSAKDPHGEFEAQNLEEQLASLQSTQHLAKEKLGFELKAFGPHWSGTNDYTVKALKQVPELEMVFFYTKGQESGKFVFERFLDLEKPIFKPNADFVISNFNTWAHKKPYICFQGHPDQWSDDRFEQFKQIVLYLKEQGCTFMTPSQYLKTQVDGGNHEQAAVQDRRWFPFVIPGDDSARNATDFSSLNLKPAGSDGFVRIKDGHFHTDSGRIKFWGMNTCFTGNFPSHDDAAKAAPFLAKLGLNAMRIHHQDRFDAPAGMWKTNEDGSREFDPVQIDKLDYFIAKMNESGIYVNLNLHVSRTLTKGEGFEDELARDFNYNKFLLYFEPRMREALKKYCRDYLLHENPYRKLRRVDDPGVAMIEITNENRFSRQGLKTVEKLPEVYREEFLKQWRNWLGKKYESTAALRTAWVPAEDEKPGKFLIDNATFGRDLTGWTYSENDGDIDLKANQPGPDADTPAFHFGIVEKAKLRWHHELHYAGLSVEEGQTYTLSFKVKAERPRDFNVTVSHNGPTNWGSVGYDETVKIGTEWETVTRIFQASKSLEGDARLCFKVGGDDADLYFADIRLQQGSEAQGLATGESLEAGNVSFPIYHATKAMTKDAKTFMMDVERDFLLDMVRYLKEDLGVKVPITGSQLDYNGAGITADTSDYADMHAYWEHPQFPGRPWDPGNWLIGNTPMEKAPGADPLSYTASNRLLDRPFTLSEWNIANPSDFGASTVPFAAMIASLQDWDGVFFFDYNANDKWFTDRMRTFFSFKAQPAKLALLGAGANLFRRGDLPALQDTAAGTHTKKVPRGLVMSHRIGVNPEQDVPDDIAKPEFKDLSSPDGKVSWLAEDQNRARVTINTDATKGAFGLIEESSIELGGLTLEIGAVEQKYAAIFLTSKDGAPIASSKQLLLVAAGHVKQNGMIWNADRTTVGKNWGEGPTQMNGIPVQVLVRDLKVSAIHALSGTGERVGKVPFAQENGSTSFEIGPSYKTVWYEIITE